MECGFVQFCDDIRHEQEGKITLIGLYQNDIVVPELPSLMPKLGVMINLNAEPKNRDVPISIEYEDEKIFSGESHVEFKDIGLPKDFKTRNFRIYMIFSPFVLSKEGLLSVKASVDGKAEIVGQIYIRQTDGKLGKQKKKIQKSRR